MSVPAPPAAGVDRGQLAALLQVSLREMLRPGVDAHTGVRGNPLLQLVLAMTFMGALFAVNVVRVADLRSFLVLLFALAMSTVVLGVAPESYEARQRKLDLLYSKPVSMRTFLAVRALVLLLLAGLIVTSLALIPLLAAGARFGSWGTLAAAYAALALGSFALVVVWLAAFARLAARVSLGTLRMATQTVLALVVLSVAGFTLSALPARMMDGPQRAPISLQDADGARWLPSTWFVDLLLGGDTPAAWAERGGALLLVALAVALLGWIDVDLMAAMERLVAPPVVRLRPPLAVRAFELWRRLPLVGERLAGGAVGALASLVLTVSGREEVSRIKALTPRLLQVAMFVLALRSAHPTLFLVMLAYFGLMGLIEGLASLRQSADAAATWLLHLAPLDGGALVRATRRGALQRYFLLPSLLLAVAALATYPPHVALVLWIGYVALAAALVAGTLLLWPRVPLAEEPSATPGMAGFAISTVLGMVALLAYSLFLAVVTLLGWVGSVLGAIAACALLAAAQLAGHLAGRRVRALEYRW